METIACHVVFWGQWLLPAAFGMYTGWLLIATVVNIASWLVSVNWQGFGIAAEV